MSRLGGRGAQFQIDLAFGAAFAAGFGYLLLVELNPLVVAFEGGLVLGYVLRVGENMLVYEHVLEEEIAAEAQTQVASEVEAQVHDEVETELEDQVHDEVAAEVEGVHDEMEATLEDQVADEVETELEQQLGDEVEAEVEAQLANLDERTDDAVEGHVREEE